MALDLTPVAYTVIILRTADPTNNKQSHSCQKNGTSFQALHACNLGHTSGAQHKVKPADDLANQGCENQDLNKL